MFGKRFVFVAALAGIGFGVMTVGSVGFASQAGKALPQSAAEAPMPRPSAQMRPEPRPLPLRPMPRPTEQLASIQMSF